MTDPAKATEKPKQTRKKRPPVFGTLIPGSPSAPISSAAKSANKVGRPTTYDASWMPDKVIEVGKGGGSITEMAVAIGAYHRETLYEWARRNPEFSDALKRAAALSQSWWEEQGRIATFGGHEGFNATSYIFQMKNRFPSSWRDVRQNEVTGFDGGPIQVETKTIDARKLSPEQREALKVALLAAKGDDDGE